MTSFLRLIARILSILSIFIIMTVVIIEGVGSGFIPSSMEWLQLALFPFGVLIGMVISWRRELLGGVIGVGSLLLYYLFIASITGELPYITVFILFTLISSPAFLFLFVGLLKRSDRASNLHQPLTSAR